MNERFLLNKGDLSRLACRLAAARDRDDDTPPIRIAFLGDSITAGSCAYEPENRYTAVVQSRWEERFGKGSAVFKNAGIGATDSYLAVHRVAEDVFSFKPDIIFIEFINDTDDEFYKTSMDSLLRRCLSRENSPAVVMIEMTQEDGTSPQRVHSEVGRLYGVPMLSYHDYILPEVAAGNVVWSDVFADTLHPNDKGHRLLGGLIADFIEFAADSVAGRSANDIFGEIKPFDGSVESPCGYKYAEAELAGRDSDRISIVSAEGFDGETSLSGFTGGWRTENGGRLVIGTEFKNLGLLYGKMTAGGGKADISVDGKKLCTLDADFTGGWGDYGTNSELLALAERGAHTIEVNVPDGQRFELLRLMLS